MDPELIRREAEFEDNLDRWLAKQGVIFQLKHASVAGSVLPKICGLLFRLLVLVVLALAIGWFYLANHVESEAFKDKVSGELASSLNASSAEISSLKRHKGGLLNAQLLISNFELESSETSFYEDWYVTTEKRELGGSVNEVNEKKIFTANSVIVQPMGLGDGIFSDWSGKKISVGTLSCHLKTGAESDELALSSYRSIFKDFSQLTVNNIKIEDANIGWGYDVSRGAIQGASIEALRRGDVWYLTVNNGKFSHGWLKNTDIDSMMIELHRSGIVKVVEANLRVGDGVLTFNADIEMKAKPKVAGSYEFRGVKVLDLVGQSYAPYFGGKVNGEGVLTGNLNTANGVSAKTKIKLEADLVKSETRASSSEKNISLRKKELAESYLIVRGKFPILSTLQELNKVNSYNLLKLNIGEFVIEQTGGDTIISDINVRSGDFLIIEGAMKYVWTKVKNKKEVMVDPDGGLNKIMTEEKNISEIANEETSVHEIVKNVSGNLRMGFVTEVFDNQPEVLGVYPEDTDTLRVWLPIKMKGELKEVTSEIADELIKIVQDARAAKENQ